MTPSRPSTPSRASAWRRLALAHASLLVVLVLAFGTWLAVPPRAGGAGGVGVASPPPDATYPPTRAFVARDGAALAYRLYEADADLLVVLVHGSTTDGRSLHLLASRLAAAGTATVAVPDLRGHGPRPARRGDVDYTGQLEDDLLDLLDHLRDVVPDRRIVLGGHSLGGGLALRFAGGRHGAGVDGYLLVAPFLHHAAPTVRPRGGGWAVPHVGRIAASTLLNTVGVSAFDAAVAIAFDVPIERRDESTTLAYSFRMHASFAPRDYAADLAAIDGPLLVVVGSDDESFRPEAFEGAVRPHHPAAEVLVVAGATHVGIVTDAGAAELVGGWLRRIARQPEACMPCTRAASFARLDTPSLP